jgi:hypothetical protein
VLLIDLADGRMKLTAAVNVQQVVQQLLLSFGYISSLSPLPGEKERVLESGW